MGPRLRGLRDGKSLKSNAFCLSTAARGGAGWARTGTHNVASAFEAAAALISIVGKSCGLQDLRPIVDGSSSVVLRPVQQHQGDAEATIIKLQ